MATAKHLSYKAAADELHLSASSVSKLVSALEAAIGKKAFVRTTREVGLTSEGEMLIPVAQRALDALSDVKELFAEHQDDGAVVGRIRLTCPSTLAVRRIAGIVASFAAKHPNIDLEFVVTDRKLDLVKEGLDMAIRVMKPTESSLLARKLVANRPVIAGTPSYLSRWPPLSSVKDLAGHRVYVLPQQLSLQFCKSRMTLQQVAKDMWHGTTNGDFLVELALCHSGLVVRPLWGLQRELDRGDLNLLELDDELTTDTGVYAVYPRNRYMPRRLRLWLDHLAASFEPQQRQVFAAAFGAPQD